MPVVCRIETMDEIEPMNLKASLLWALSTLIPVHHVGALSHNMNKPKVHTPLTPVTAPCLPKTKKRDMGASQCFLRH
jgi:hypothetical protein